MSEKKWTPEQVRAAIASLCDVSFYARINHGSKASDYGEIVNPALERLGLPTGEPSWSPEIREALSQARGER